MTQTQPTKRTPEIRFRIVEPSPGVFSNSKPEYRVWFRVLEPGQNYGKDLSIPTYHPEYSESMGQTLRGLSDGDIVTATLVSNSQQTSNWRVETLDA